MERIVLKTFRPDASPREELAAQRSANLEKDAAALISQGCVHDDACSDHLMSEVLWNPT